MTAVAPYYIDLTHFVPTTWREDLMWAARTLTHHVEKPAGPGSLSARSAGLDYEIATTEALLAQERLAWLATIHRATLPALHLPTLGATPDEALLPIEGPSGINLNVLSPDSTRAGLEWHLDGRDVERVVILSPNGPWDESRGGTLMWHDGEEVHHQAIDVHARQMPGRCTGLSVATGDTPHAVNGFGLSQESRVTLMFAYTTHLRRHRFGGAGRMEQDRYNAEPTTREEITA